MKIGRALYTQNWLTASISVHVTTLPGIRSYHVPIMFEASFTPYKFMYHLKFLTCGPSLNTVMISSKTFGTLRLLVSLSLFLIENSKFSRLILGLGIRLSLETSTSWSRLPMIISKISKNKLAHMASLEIS